MRPRKISLRGILIRPKFCKFLPISSTLLGLSVSISSDKFILGLLASLKRHFVENFGFLLKI